MTPFNTNLRAAREKVGMTRQELADSIGISVSALGQYEQGRREPDLQKLIALATELCVSVDDLLGYKVNEVQNTIDYLHDYGMMIWENDSKHVQIICSSNDFFLPKAKSSPEWSGLSVSLSEETFLAIIRYAKDRTKKRRDDILVSECERLFLFAWLKQLTYVSSGNGEYDDSSTPFLSSPITKQEKKALDELFSRITAQYKHPDHTDQTKEKAADPKANGKHKKD